MDKMNLSNQKKMGSPELAKATPLDRSKVIDPKLSGRELGSGSCSVPKTYTTRDKAVPFPGAKKAQ